MKRSGTRPYLKFVSELQVALLTPDPKGIAPLLDGLAGERCLDLVSPKSVRRLGAFFTPSKIAQRLVDQFSIKRWTDNAVFDPACGAGDLLLPVARTLPLRETVSSTLRLWKNHIFGCDLSPEFIKAAQLRMVLLAAARGSRIDQPPDELAKILTNFVVADGLSLSNEYSKSSYIVMNPPFGRVDCGVQPWREGSVTAAALFLERAARLCAQGAEIAALLPEVLRTGSSYEHWRNHISRFVKNAQPQSMGLFSEEADVDVFMQHFRKCKAWDSVIVPQRAAVQKTLGERFLVAVGSVVPHRDKLKGPYRAYLHSKNAVPWAEVRRISETRRFTGRTFTPPFVVVRRTSRPGDPHRATATLVLGKRKVAVENHLLVIIPKQGGVSACRSLLRELISPQIDEFLDKTMRCRHLTTASVSSLPLP